MELQWFGKDSCLMKSGTVKIAINPRKEFPKPTCDMVVTSIDEPTLFHTIDDTFLCDWPGEYELKDILVSGIEAEDPDLLGVFTVFNMHLPEDMAVCIVSGLKSKISAQQAEKLGSIDVLLLELEAGHLTPKVAQEITDILEPKAVVLLCDDEAAKEEYTKLLGVVPQILEGTLKLQVSALPAEGVALYLPTKNA